MVERLGEMRKGRRERIEKGCHCCFFKSSGYDKLELKHQNLFFYKLIECILKKRVAVAFIPAIQFIITWTLLKKPICLECH